MTAADQLPEILRNPVFELGAAKPQQFPNDDRKEVAFAGRSNVGKSSAINAITNRTKLARTSKVPGRTQQINFFSLNEQARLVDLPGYGFAKVPLSVKKEWQKTIHTYLADRDNLLVLILLMDIRNPLTDLDQQMLDWAYESSLATQVLLTKADKLKSGKRRASQLSVEKQIESRYQDQGGMIAVEPFSAQSGLGVIAIRQQIAEWLSS
ncbi:MAG: ribosome biogenesis GTP-binding protein YihA/YsxC [Pseudomonadota bacterium]